VLFHWAAPPQRLAEPGAVVNVVDLILLYVASLLVMLAAKILGLVAWSWWIVLAPLWVPYVAATVGFIITITVYSFFSNDADDSTPN
jgi:hypothetical protein